MNQNSSQIPKTSGNNRSESLKPEQQKTVDKIINLRKKQAKEIEEGQIFIARLDSVEGMDKVVLVPVVKYDKDGCPSYEVRLE